MISIENLTKNYNKTRALENVSLEIKKGESVALLGPNGAGKSTLIKCLLSVLDYKGKITINSADVRTESKLAKSYLAYVPQEPSFYDIRTIDILNFYKSIRKNGTKSIDEVLETVRLSDHRNKYTSELSGGMKQRLSFAIALLSDCPVLVLDEPTSNLDKESRGELLELTKKLKESGKTIVFSSHRLDEVYYLSDRVIFLQAGIIVKDCPMEKFATELDHKVKMYIFFQNTETYYVSEFLEQRGYVVDNSGTDFISLHIKSNLKLEPVKELLDKRFEVVDFIVEGHNLDIN